MSNFVLTQSRDHLVEIILNRVEKRNAIHWPMMLELEAAIEAAAKTPGARAILIRGEGSGFSAGIDLTGFAEMVEIYGENWRDNLFPVTAGYQSIVNKFERCGLPTIALLHGYCLGLGLELALACDFRIATEGTKIGLPRIAVRVNPGCGWHNSPDTPDWPVARETTVVGTIGIRGSGMDISCEGRCAEGNRVRGAPNTAPARGEGLFLHSWLGIFEVTFDSQSFTVNENQTAFFASGGVPPVLLPALPAFLRDNPAPRPDRVPVDLGNLFGVQTRDPATPGLYVLVRDGHVSLVQDGRVFDLGRGEAGYADPRGTQLMRLDVRPPFMEFDRFPRPDEFDDKVQRILEFVSGERDRPTGRGAECEVR